MSKIMTRKEMIAWGVAEYGRGSYTKAEWRAWADEELAKSQELAADERTGNTQQASSLQVI